MSIIDRDLLNRQDSRVQGFLFDVVLPKFVVEGGAEIFGLFGSKFDESYGLSVEVSEFLFEGGDGIGKNVTSKKAAFTDGFIVFFDDDFNLFFFGFDDEIDDFFDFMNFCVWEL